MVPQLTPMATAIEAKLGMVKKRKMTRQRFGDICEVLQLLRLVESERVREYEDTQWFLRRTRGFLRRRGYNGRELVCLL